MGEKFCSNCGSSVDLSNKPGSRTIGGQRKVGSNNSNPFNQIQDYYEQTKKQYGNLTDQELGFVGSVKYALVHWIDFKGVESRKSVYWWLCLGIIVISICIGILEEILVVLFSNIPVLDVIGTFIVLVAMIAWGGYSVNCLSFCNSSQNEIFKCSEYYYVDNTYVSYTDNSRFIYRTLLNVN